LKYTFNRVILSSVVVVIWQAKFVVELRLGELSDSNYSVVGKYPIYVTTTLFVAEQLAFYWAPTWGVESLVTLQTSR
jgi:sterol desaturase/sphingolipid hydroxylase (fatty acid hydroxylase superfamily)